MPFPKEHSCRVHEPGIYKSMRRENGAFASGIDVIWGVKEDDSAEVQAIRFDKDKYSVEQAKKWVKDNHFTCIEFEVASPEEPDITTKLAKPETMDIDDQEIFAVGEWTSNNGKKKYTLDDLKSMVDAKFQLKEHLQIPIKLGHNEKQSALFADGLPAAGWCENLRVKGDKLVADLKRIPKKIFEVIQAGAYRQKSLEICHGFEDEATGKSFKHAPVGLAILGAQLPALSNLNDLLALYSVYSVVVPEHGEEKKSVMYYKANAYALDEGNSPGGESTMTEEEIKALQDEIAALKAENADLKAKIDEASKASDHQDELPAGDSGGAAAAAENVVNTAEKVEEIVAAAVAEVKAEVETLKEDKIALTEEVAQLSKARDVATGLEREAFLDKHAKKFTPSMRASWKMTLENATSTPDKFSFKSGEATLTGEAAVRAEIEALEVHPAMSEYGKGDENRSTSSDERRKAKVSAYLKEHEMPDTYNNNRAALQALVKSGAVSYDDGEV